MTMLDQVLSLVQQALDDFDKPDITVSNLVRRAIRIARLRNDFDNLWWLELEMQAIDPGSKARARTTPEMLAHYEHREFRELTNRELAAYFSRRRWPAFDSKGVPQVNKRSESFFPRSVAEIEAELASISEQIASAVPPPGLHTLDLYYRDQELSKVRQVLSTKAELLRGILEAIRQRVYQFLIDTEHGLVYGQLNADIFERNRRYVPCGPQPPPSRRPAAAARSANAFQLSRRSIGSNPSFRSSRCWSTRPAARSQRRSWALISDTPPAVGL
jgi:hypothetical protein